MKRIYGIIYTLATLLLITACTADGPETAQQSQQLKLAATLDSESGQTRTVTSGLQTTQLDDANTVGAFIYRKGQTASQIVDGEDYGYTNKQFTPVSGVTTLYSPSQPVFPYKGTGDQLKVDVYAYAPYDATWTAFTGAKTFSVKADQKTKANYIASDLLWATPLSGEAPDGNPFKNLTLQFSHMLSQVYVEISAGDGVTTSQLAGATVALNGVVLSGTINLQDGTLTPSTSTGSVSMLKCAFDEDDNAIPSTDANYADYFKGSAVVYPIATLPTTVTLTITTSVTTYTANLKTTAITKWEAGKKYIYQVSISATGLVLATTVSDWTPGGTTSGTAE